MFDGNRGNCSALCLSLPSTVGRLSRAFDCDLRRPIFRMRSASGTFECGLCQQTFDGRPSQERFRLWSMPAELSIVICLVPLSTVVRLSRAFDCGLRRQILRWQSASGALPILVFVKDSFHRGGLGNRRGKQSRKASIRRRGDPEAATDQLAQSIQTTQGKCKLRSQASGSRGD
jgi:hypothetical protein